MHRFFDAVGPLTMSGGWYGNADVIAVDFYDPLIMANNHQAASLSFSGPPQPETIRSNG